ncbi:phosphonate C-P lyase system protein PhnH [Pseudaminobacter arsenicus]|uniref:Phosphonate C-P lyase system protein PhnH n=1 Tax=Borborobacter arsenicus TaxID=1851146 RepID=A0A432V8L6_9HYPH|nr:phosphonate C-P lyase system protein PhnH [Pseudaminobacter arsenicus]RUM98413.1 phosphonate C-P lyase system protein PhnH [Pseudaminobacter arsenicus]
MRNESTALDGGFSAPVQDAQAVFRAVMDAMARPATIVEIRPPVTPPAPLPPIIGAIASTLLDADTPIWLDPTLGQSPEVGEWLVFHTGASFTDQPGEASFALIGDGSAFPDLDTFAQGTQEYPDRSATLVIAIEAFDGGTPLCLRGPGILDRATIAPRGLPKDFAEQWEENTQRFPRGVDLVLATGDSLVCLPRTARLIAREMEV